jgi:predicted nucleic acid-binding protein
LIVFLDTSALGSMYLGDEDDGAWIAEVVFTGHDPVVVCELADVELASLLARALRGGRITEAEVAERLDAWADHTCDDGPIGVAPVRSDTLARARSLVLEEQVRTLDAIHLAAAQVLAEASDDAVTLLTRDARQASAAVGVGLPLYERPTR